ncbi:MAG TPA: UDP-N-acetylglucosamine 2-epimerase (non-hydrolyzing) [Terriglobales bacterium]|jgi:UDP-N-acetylglucosamine 2-epimerase (non-hydrolysing)
MKVSVIVGTRPEAIKLAPVILGLRQDPRFECHVCATAQHRQMLDQVFEVFGIQPDADLNLMRPDQSLPELTCAAISSVTKYLVAERPDLVLVQGDTTTVLAASLAAFYQNIPVGHVEAGLRTGNMQAPWPEEANRVLTSRLTSMHFVPTDGSRNNLLREGIAEDQIFLTGNTVIDALYQAVDRVRKNPPNVPGLDSKLMKNGAPLVLITGHRRENFGEKLESACLAIAELAVRFSEAQFVYPVHLNPRVRSTVWETLVDDSGRGLDNVHLIDPLSYLPFVALMERATVVMTDSGGIQEEAPALGKPVLVMRDCTERPEALAGGTVKLVGTDQAKIVAEVSQLLSNKNYYEKMARVQTPYGDGHATERILESIALRFGVNALQVAAGTTEETVPLN